jgi:hypothetical protein
VRPAEQRAQVSLEPFDQCAAPFPTA